MRSIKLSFRLAGRLRLGRRGRRGTRAKLRFAPFEILAQGLGEMRPAPLGLRVTIRA
jgi:hypothetical protein